MKNFSLRKLALAFGFAAATSFTQHASADDAQTSVWKVSKGEDIVYVGGTIHILPISEFPLPADFTEVYEKSDNFFGKVTDRLHSRFEQISSRMSSLRKESITLFNKI